MKISNCKTVAEVQGLNVYESVVKEQSPDMEAKLLLTVAMATISCCRHLNFLPIVRDKGPKLITTRITTERSTETFTTTINSIPMTTKATEQRDNKKIEEIQEHKKKVCIDKFTAVTILSVIGSAIMILSCLLCISICKKKEQNYYALHITEQHKDSWLSLDNNNGQVTWTPLIGTPKMDEPIYAVPKKHHERSDIKTTNDKTDETEYMCMADLNPLALKNECLEKESYNRQNTTM